MAWPAVSRSNPYIPLLYGEMLAQDASVTVADFTPRRLLAPRGRPDILHVHWPDNVASIEPRVRRVFETAAIRAAISVGRRRGTRVVWTVHNLQAHDEVDPERGERFREWFTRRVDGLVSLSAAAAREVVARYPVLAEVPLIVTPHGHYAGAYPRSIGRAEARARLGVPDDATVLLYFGQVRPYKNVVRLVRSFTEIGDPGLRLLVAGRPSAEGLAEEVRSAAAGDARVRLHLDFVADADVQLFFHAADLVVLPYDRVLNSGVVFLALSFGVPVLVPAGEAVGELQEMLGDDAVRTYRNTFDAVVLRSAVADLHARTPARDALIDRTMQRLDRRAIAADTLAFFRRVAGRGKP